MTVGNRAAMLLRVWPAAAGAVPLGNGARLPSGAVTPGAPVWIPADDASGGLRVWPDPPSRPGEGESERDGLGEGLPVGVGAGVPVGEGEGVPVGVGDGVPVGVGEGVPVGVGDGVPVGEGEGVPVGVGEGVPVGKGDGEPAADGGHAAAEVACCRACPELAAASVLPRIITVIPPATSQLPARAPSLIVTARDRPGSWPRGLVPKGRSAGLRAPGKRGFTDDWTQYRPERFRWLAGPPAGARSALVQQRERRLSGGVQDGRGHGCAGSAGCAQDTAVDSDDHAVPVLELGSQLRQSLPGLDPGWHTVPGQDPGILAGHSAGSGVCRGWASAEFVSAVIMRVPWQDAGGWSVVTDGVHLQLASRRPGKLPGQLR